MSTNNYILNLLNIKDKNIYINENFTEERRIGNKNYKIIEGFLTYIPEFCPCCGAINISHNDIIKCLKRIAFTPLYSIHLSNFIVHQHYLTKNPLFYFLNTHPLVYH